ncbi:MAG: hypothetical protein KUG82_20885 [Pseudomonadales bacterium]|nr:hypothetical protein [Pseudomonadales bacterium]
MSNKLEDFQSVEGGKLSQLARDWQEPFILPKRLEGFYLYFGSVDLMLGNRLASFFCLVWRACGSTSVPLGATLFPENG